MTSALGWFGLGQNDNPRADCRRASYNSLEFQTLFAENTTIGPHRSAIGVQAARSALVGRASDPLQLRLSQQHGRSNPFQSTPPMHHGILTSRSTMPASRRDLGVPGSLYLLRRRPGNETREQSNVVIGGNRSYIHARWNREEQRRKQNIKTQNTAFRQCLSTCRAARTWFYRKASCAMRNDFTTTRHPAAQAALGTWPVEREGFFTQTLPLFTVWPL